MSFTLNAGDIIPIADMVGWGQGMARPSAKSSGPITVYLSSEFGSFHKRMDLVNSGQHLITIARQGGGDFAIPGSPNSSTVVLAPRDQVTISKNSGFDELPVVQKSSIINDANSLAIIGDSFTSNSWSGSATTAKWLARGYITVAMQLSGHRLNVVPGGMCAVGGSGVSADINGVKFDTQLTNAIATGARNLIVMGGVNDAKADIDPLVVIAAYKNIIARATAAGMRVFLCTQPCQSSASSTYSVARQGAMLAIQQAMRLHCAKQNPANVVLVETAGAYIDALSATADPKTNYVYASDKLHPTNLGAYFMGKELAAKIIATIPSVPSVLVSNADNVAFNAQSRNLIANGLMVNNTSGLATGFTTAGSGTIGTMSVAPRADNRGQKQVMPFTFTAASQYVRYNFPTVSSGINDGDMVYAEAEVTLASPVNVNNVRFIATLTGSNLTFTASSNDMDSSNDVSFTEGFTYLLRSEPIIYQESVHGSLTSFGVMIQVGAGAAASGSGSLEISQAAVWKVV